ncbi:MAG: gluconokinase [Verrucomicrobiota bacterium]
MVIIVMGVSGSGKSTVGSLLAKACSGSFYDGDDFHPEANIRKMHAGIALEDADRLPWLERLRALILEREQGTAPTVLACSALKTSYRDVLAPDADPRVQFVFLRGDFDLIRQRLEARQHHFMPESLLASQFGDLELPENALVVDISQTPEAIVEEILCRLGLTDS